MVLSALIQAAPSDRNEIVSLIHDVIEHLGQSGIPQWDDEYPRASDVDEDLRKGQLFLVRTGKMIAGIITLNRVYDPAYKNGRWEYTGERFMVVHRLCVTPKLQGHAIGTRIMRMTEAMLREHGVESMRLDVFSKNPGAIRLYEKLGYRIVGEALWRKGLFYLMEKPIFTAYQGNPERSKT